MKMLVTRIAAPGGALPFVLADLKAHLRVEHTADDASITAQGRMAALELETFASLALLSQTVRLTIFDPALMVTGIHLPIGPVLPGATLTILADGAPFTDFQLAPGPRPFLAWGPTFDLRAPTRLTIEYSAGYGPTAADIPADLLVALYDGACAVYDLRAGDGKGGAARSPHMARIAARHRGVAA